MLWTRLLASGTGNTTYVFTIILGIFLIGLAIGALLFNFIRPRITDPIRLLAFAQILVAALVIGGLVTVVVRPEALAPGATLETLQALIGSAILVVLPVTIVLGLSFPAASALLADDAQPRRLRIRIARGGQHGRRDRRQRDHPVPAHPRARIAARRGAARAGQRGARASPWRSASASLAGR